MKSIFEVASLICILGKVDGRKRLQKIVYLLQQKGFPFAEDFEYGQFGPYSRELSSEIGVLVENDLIYEETEATMLGDRFKYEPTAALHESLEINSDNVKLHAGEKEMEIITIINKEATNVLEVASSMLFLLKSGHTGERLARKLQEWKPNLQAFVPEARELLSQLGFDSA